MAREREDGPAWWELAGAAPGRREGEAGLVGQGDRGGGAAPRLAPSYEMTGACSL
jgi:hypothetical protein